MNVHFTKLFREQTLLDQTNARPSNNRDLMASITGAHCLYFGFVEASDSVFWSSFYIHTSLHILVTYSKGL